MVEFGLKLEDNKVEEWQEKYIDYEGLKKLIKEIKKQREITKELEKRNPSIAAGVKAAFMVNRSESKSEPDALKPDTDDTLNASLHSQADSDAGEKTKLLISGMGEVSNSKYGSNTNLSIPSMKSSSNSLANFFGLAKTYEMKLTDAFEGEQLAFEKFTIAIYQEASKVNGFYRDHVEEMEQQFDFLRENTGDQYKFAKKKKLHPLRSMRMSLGLINMGTHQSGLRQSFAPSMHGMDSDEEDEELTGEDKSKRLENEKEADSIKRALTDMHRRSKLLDNYSNINSTGFIKIIKKFYKSFPDKKGEFDEIKKDGFICGEGKKSHEICSTMEQLYAKWFCSGNEIEARSLMLPKRNDGLDMDWSQLRLGYRLGMCTIMTIWVTWDCIWGFVSEGHHTIGATTAFPVFRACAGLLLVHWFWGISVYVWNRYRINYIFLFDFDPRIVDSPFHIFEDAVDESLVFLLLMLLYYKSCAKAIPEILAPGWYPFFLVLYTIKNLIFPWKTRKHLWKAIFAVISAPITSPTFFHTYVADVFTSMVKVFQDILWTGCFIVSGDFMIAEAESGAAVGLKTEKWSTSVWYRHIVVPLICLFPLWIRFNQCLRRYLDTGMRVPNLPNAGKYALSQTVTLFGAFHPLYLMHRDHSATGNLSDDVILQEIDSVTGGLRLFDFFWFGIFVTTSLYSYFWDVCMDWGLGKPKFGMLGSRLMYPNKSYYYYVIVLDLFLRFMWLTTLIPPDSGASFEVPYYLSFATMAMELFRRTIWGFFRIEHEHRHNTSGFRRVDFVPLHFSTGGKMKPQQKREHVGWTVLGEVLVITVIVVSISAGSVIAAQKATNGMAMKNPNAPKDL